MTAGDDSGSPAGAEPGGLGVGGVVVPAPSCALAPAAAGGSAVGVIDAGARLALKVEVAVTGGGALVGACAAALGVGALSAVGSPVGSATAAGAGAAAPAGATGPGVGGEGEGGNSG